MGKMLTRELLLTKQPLKIVKVELDSDLFVYVRQMTARERDRFEQSLWDFEMGEDGTQINTRRMDDFRAKLCVNTVCDEQGNNIFEPTDVELLSQSISAERAEKIVSVSQSLNEISKKDKENMVKNSLSAKKDVSNSASV